MNVRFWGVRGSLPAPLTTPLLEMRIRQALLGASEIDLQDSQAVDAYVSSLPLHLRGTYGGNTPCVEIRNQAGDLIIMDAGSGIRNLGVHLMQQEFGHGQGEAVILFSHTHWDHIQGLPFFVPLFKEGNRFHLCGRHPGLQERLTDQQDPRFFPIDIAYYSASLTFTTLGEDEELFDGRFRVKSIRQDHPGDSYAYRFEADGKTFVYASDAEYKEQSDQYLKPYLEFFKGADAVVFDAQFNLWDTLYEKVDWGHSSAMIGIDMATEADVGTLVLFHHDHFCTDQQIYEIFNDALRYLRRMPGGSALRVVVGYEGLDLQL